MLRHIFSPQTLVFLVPIVAIICAFAYKTTKMRLEHEERIARIEAGFDPDGEL